MLCSCLTESLCQQTAATCSQAGRQQQPDALRPRRLKQLQTEASGGLQRLGAAENAQKYVAELLARQFEQYRHNLVLEGEKRQELLAHMRSLEVSVT